MKRTQAKIGTLVKDMLTISKDRDPERAPVDLNGLAREILQESADKASAAEIELIAETDSALPAAMLDPIWMHDSMLNLVGNAIDALKDTRTPMGRVIVRTRFDRERSRILCETIDNGPGVPAEARERIFEPFYSTKGSRGSGLGLSVVRKYAEEHGGTLTLETAPGQGAAFLLDLPFIAVEGSETEESSLPARSAEPTR
jgi:signal transduction histidine kinase